MSPGLHTHASLQRVHAARILPQVRSARSVPVPPLLNLAPSRPHSFDIFGLPHPPGLQTSSAPQEAAVDAAIAATGATAAPPPPPPPPPAALVVNPGEAGSLADGQAALAQNPLFKTLTHDSDCFDFDAQSCVTNSPASCFEFKFTLSPPCPGDQICAALPFANGTSVSCTTQAEVDALIAATGAKDPKQYFLAAGFKNKTVIDPPRSPLQTKSST
ncbi:hypothetical protein B0H10DRAFT_2211067 [Mycena sp. CBHHK59/15]|nr:hypothetical protein B0H10DRAFT_2211067 [Mycena sp. CBHHK59/15]